MTFLIFGFSLALILKAKGQSKSFKTIGRVNIETPFAKQNNFFQWYYDGNYYEKARQAKDFECLVLSYESDTATVEAWLYKPMLTEGKNFHHQLQS
jgi:hypothetical protein